MWEWESEGGGCCVVRWGVEEWKELVVLFNVCEIGEKNELTNNSKNSLDNPKQNPKIKIQNGTLNNP